MKLIIMTKSTFFVEEDKIIVSLFANTPPTDAFAQDGVIETSREAGNITLEISGRLDEAMAKAATFGITDIETIPVSLEEIFLAYYGKGNGDKHD